MGFLAPALYVFCGFTEILLQQVFIYNGAAKTKILLLLVGDISRLVWYFRHKNQPNKEVNQMVYWAATLTQVFGRWLGTIGLSFVGSGLYIVLYSSSTTFCAAFFSAVIHKKSFNKGQLAAFGLISMGLLIVGMDLHGDSAVDLSEILKGTAITIFSSLIQTLSLVYMEGPMKEVDFSTSLFVLGAQSTVVDLALLVMFTLPNWEEQFTRPIEEKGGSVSVVLFMYVVTTVVNIVKAFGWAATMQDGGSVVLGMLQALKCVSIFSTSAVLFCKEQPSQCFSTAKAICTLLVVGGVYIYSQAKQSQPKGRQSKD